MLAVPTTCLSAASELRQIFAEVNPTSCPKRLNFHLHTQFSDGKLDPCEVVDQAIALGVRHFAITDHHTIEGYLRAKKYLDSLRAQNPDQTEWCHLWIGAEINASLLFTEVHILAYGFDPHHPAMQPYIQGRPTAGLEYQAVNVVQAIHRAGGLAVLAHPARYRRSVEELIPPAASIGIDGVP